MTGPEARAIRERLGLRVEDMAGTLALTPHAVEGWESGAARVPREVARDLRWRDAVTAQEAAMQANGLTECGHAKRWWGEVIPSLTGRKRTKAMADFEAHFQTCPICQARAEFAKTLPPLPPPPVGRALRVFGAFVEWIDRRPRWLHTPLWTGAGFAAITILRVAGALLGTAARGGTSRIVYAGLAAIPASAATGFVVGLIWTAFTPLRARGRGAAIAANVLAGVAIVAFFLGIVLLLRL